MYFEPSLAATKAVGQIAQSNPRTLTPTAVADLLPLLKVPDSEFFSAAAVALGQVAKSNPDAVVGSLLPLLKDTNSDVRSAAATALGQAVGSNSYIAMPTVVGSLVPLLKDTDAHVRSAAAAALGHVANVNRSAFRRSYPAFAQMLMDRDPVASLLALMLALQLNYNTADTLHLLQTTLTSANVGARTGALYMVDNALRAVTALYRDHAEPFLQALQNPHSRPVALGLLLPAAQREPKRAFPLLHRLAKSRDADERSALAVIVQEALRAAPNNVPSRTYYACCVRSRMKRYARRSWPCWTIC